jgi:hypothetical protein
MKWKKRNGLPLMQQVDRTCTIKRSCQATSPFVNPLQFLQGNSSRDTKAVSHSRLLHSNCSLLPCSLLNKCWLLRNPLVQIWISPSTPHSRWELSRVFKTSAPPKLFSHSQPSQIYIPVANFKQM